MKSWIDGFGSSFVIENDRWFGVSVEGDKDARKVTARTLDKHPLVGHRYWTVKKDPKYKCLLHISTNSVYKYRNLANRLAGLAGGDSAVKDLWTSYMKNNANAAARKWKGIRGAVQSN